MSVRVCGTCGDIPCRCEKGRCSQCGVELNLDAIGLPLMDWNREHQRVTGCKGVVVDLRIMGDMENDLQKQLDYIQKMKKEVKH